MFLAEETNTIIDEKSLEKEEKITNNMLVSNTNEQKEKKVVNKSKYPKNERVRVSKMYFQTHWNL